MNTSIGLSEQKNDQRLDEAERLIWALLDQPGDEADVHRLEKLIVENEQVRRRYMECVQLHADLCHHFGAIPQHQNGSPVLSFLGSLSSSAESQVNEL